MKKLVGLLAALIICAGILTACGAAGGEMAQFRSQLTKNPWSARMSEGTTAQFTFDENGSFVCKTMVSADGRSGTVSREGTYTIAEADNGFTVCLQYAQADFTVEIICEQTDGGYQLSVAGCALEQE